MTTPADTVLPLSPARRIGLGTVIGRIGPILVIGLPILTLILLIFYPLAAIILQSIFPNLYATKPDLTLQLGLIGQVLSQKHTYVSVFNTLWLSIITVVITCGLGTLLAVLTERTDLPGRRVFRLLVWLVFFTPSYMLGEAWTIILIPGSLPDHYLHFSRALIQTLLSPLGVILARSPMRRANSCALVASLS